MTPHKTIHSTHHRVDGRRGLGSPDFREGLGLPANRDYRVGHRDQDRQQFRKQQPKQKTALARAALSNFRKMQMRFIKYTLAAARASARQAAFLAVQR
jgi:hypothetical protein